MRKNLFCILTLFLFAGFAMAQEGGCLNAINGQYPSGVYQPECSGIPESIVTTAWSGEYSKVQLTEGVEYQFSSSIPTDFLTISDENGQNVLIYGTTPLTYTADSNRIIRFYTHVDSDCTEDQEDRARIIQCGETQTEPDYGCSQTYDFGTIAYSSSIEPNYGMTANDFFVPKDYIQYYLNSVTVMMYAMAGSETDFTTFDLKILDDDNGKPGTEIYSKTGIDIYEAVNKGELYMGYMIYKVRIDLDPVELPVNPDEDSRYWIVFQSHSLNNFDMFWVLYPYTEGWRTQPAYTSSNNGQSWTKVTQYGTGDHYDGFMEIDADCGILGLNDLEAAEFSFYPNPVNDILNINSEKNIRQLTVTNAAGQKVLTLSDKNISKIDMSRFVPGTYFIRALLEDGRIETFKIVKK